MRCVTHGNSELLYAEGRLWPRKMLTPYARLGVGRAHLEGHEFLLTPYAENRIAIGAEIGLEFHYQYFSIRGFGFDSEAQGSPLDESSMLGYGLQLGVRL